MEMTEVTKLILYLFHVQLQVRRQEIYQIVSPSIQRQHWENVALI